MKFKVVVRAFAVVLALVSMSVFALTEKSKQALLERIAPIGQVCQAGNPRCAVAVNTGAPRAGDIVYGASCIACHGTGVAGAPKMGDKGSWSARIAAGKNVLYDHAIKGFNAMPAKGACASCSEAEIKAAVDYMLSQSK